MKFRIAQYSFSIHERTEPGAGFSSRSQVGHHVLITDRLTTGKASLGVFPTEADANKAILAWLELQTCKAMFTLKPISKG